MPAWIDTKNEIASRNNNYDLVRRERIRAVEELTGRPLIIYSTAFLENEKVRLSQGEVGIDNYDPVGIDEVISIIEGENLDVLLHSPGGSPEAAEAIVSLLRSRFSSIRFIVPHMAKSAATMICCAGDEILMDNRSELGPIDPQMQLLRGDNVVIRAPAQAIIKQFDNAKESLAKNPKEMAAWLPILQPLSPSLLTECENANDLAYELVLNWLRNYMFHDEAEKEALSENIATYLSASENHLSHGRRIGIDKLKELRLKVVDLREFDDLRNAIWNLYLSIMVTLQDTTAFKIIESCHGSAFIRKVIVQQITLPDIQQLPPGQPQQQNRQANKRRRH